MNPTLVPYLEPLPLIAVLRGITPEEIRPSVRTCRQRLSHPRGAAQFAAALRLDRRARGKFGDAMSRRGGNGDREDEVKEVAPRGGQLIVMPHGDTP
jgi:2-dehydro-3-deoxyphosphogalactonate aldolase